MQRRSGFRPRATEPDKHGPERTGIESHGLLKQFACTQIVVGTITAKMLDAAQQAVIGWQAVSSPACRDPDFGILQPARDRGDDGLCQFVLNFKKLFNAAIK